MEDECIVELFMRYGIWEVLGGGAHSHDRFLMRGFKVIIKYNVYIDCFNCLILYFWGVFNLRLLILNIEY